VSLRVLQHSASYLGSRVCDKHLFIHLPQQLPSVSACGVMLFLPNAVKGLDEEMALGDTGHMGSPGLIEVPQGDATFQMGTF
jgi:hypothetical protein